MNAFRPPLPDTRPRLAIVVDTEEEFDWDQPFCRSERSTASVPAQSLAHEIYDRLAIVPTYVVGYPIAVDPIAARFFRKLAGTGRAEIGAHLHPWVTPPHDEVVTRRNSYACNLPPALERAKIEELTVAISENLGVQPTAFKAGRHGFGPHTPAILADLGYRVDCSVMPCASFASDGGPDFHGWPDQPYWLDRDCRLLEIPISNGCFGPLARFGRTLQPLFDSVPAKRLRIPGLLSRSGLLTRARLTPEGVSAAEQCRLLDALVARGMTTFTMVYHSPSLAPGNTPYIRDAGDLATFLATIETVLRYFRDTLSGRFTTLSQIHAEHESRLPARGMRATEPLSIEQVVVNH